MNIWYLNHYAGGPGFGKFLRSHHLAKHWQRTGHRCTVFFASYHHLLAGKLTSKIKAEDIDYVPLDAREYNSNGVDRFLNILDFCFAIPDLKRRTDEFGVPDAIILSSAPPMGIFPAFRLAKAFNAKLVFEVRDLWPLSITEIANKSCFHPLSIASAISERFAYKHSHLCASLLGNAEQYMRKRGLRGSFVHVPNGYEPTSAKGPCTEAGRAALSQIREWQEAGRQVIIHPGAQGVPNALQVLIDACRKLYDSGNADRIGVLLLGEGTETERLKEMAKGLPIVAFFPNIPKDEALYVTESCDIGYAGACDHRAVYRYGISFNKIADFMGAGLPVIVPFYTRGDPVSESQCGIVADSDEPELVASAITTLINLPPEERRQMGLRGKCFAEKTLSYSEIAQRYIAAIRSA